MQLLITGAAGFIGFHLTKYRLAMGDTIIGIDNLNEYYDPRLKLARLEQLKAEPNFIFYEADISDKAAIDGIFAKHRPERVVNLAAQAGVRYSLTHPHIYAEANVVGFTTIIEACRQYEIKHLVYASTSSVYGANGVQPFSEAEATNHPLTIYAATKKANELIAHSYSSLYQLPTTGLRFFTVYGPWGRPDMAFFSFTKAIIEGKPIQVFNQGQMQRDFTFIDDIVAGISLAIDKEASPDLNWSALNPDASSSYAPYRIYNIGCGNPINLLDYINALEEAIGKKAIKDFQPLQQGDVLSTHADTKRLEKELGYLPRIDFKEGVRQFVSWYKEFYAIKD